MQRKQQSFSYPAFFHLATKLKRKIFMKFVTRQLTVSVDSLGVRIPLLQQPVIELPANGLTLVIQLIDIS